MMRRSKHKPDWIKEMALERIETLLALASEKPAMSKRYVSLALAISRRYNVSIPAAWKRHICRKCCSLLTEGKNLRVRVSQRPKAVVYTCLGCRSARRYPHKAKVFKKGKPKTHTRA